MYVEQLNRKRNKILIISIILSLLLHALIIILFLMGFTFHKPSTTETKKIKVTLKKRKPVVPPARQQKQPEIPPQFFELVDNPNANQQRPDKANMLAEKSSVAAAPEASDQTALARSKPQKQKFQEETVPEKPENSREREKPLEKTNHFKFTRPSEKGVFNRNAIGKPLNKPFDASEVGTTNPSREKNKVFDPRQIGKLALSTYAWEYAPYMKSWLRFLQNHWFAPPAYTELGLIQGQTIVRFRIYPDGHMEGLEVLYHEGHPSLQESSINAVKASFPFKPLPDDFPDPYLEVTLRMLYPSLRRYAQ